MAELQTVASPRRSRRRKWLAVVLVALFLISVFYGALYWYMGRPLADAEAEADRLDPGWRLAELDAKRPALGDGENAAWHIAATKRLLPGGWEKPFEDAFQPAPDPHAPFTPRQQTVLRDELLLLTPAVEEANRLINTPQAHFGIAWDTRWINASMTPVMDARILCNLLRYEAWLHAQDKDGDRALLTCRAMLNSAAALTSEPIMISLLVRIACQAVTLGTLERVLSLCQPSEAALTRLQRALEAAEANDALLDVLRGERAFGDLSIRAGADPSFGFVMTGNPKADRVLGSVLGGSARANHAAYLRFMNQIVESAKRPPDEQIPAIIAVTNDPNLVKRLAVKQLAPAVLKVIEAHRRGRAQLRVMILLIAVERYRLQHGRWPASLTEITPALIAKVPLDPFDGQPLRYRRLADGIVIYSVGRDGEDNGGKLDRGNPIAAGCDLGYQLWDVKQGDRP